jgi:HSP20 family protein
MIDRVLEDWDRALSAVERSNSLALDVHENDNQYVITADIPGVKEEDIEIQLHDDVLTISVETRYEKREEKGAVLLQERRYGKFSRSLRFPVNVNGDAIEADYNNGVLTVTIPKAEEVKPRRITIKARSN